MPFQDCGDRFGKLVITRAGLSNSGLGAIPTGRAAILNLIVGKHANTNTGCKHRENTATHKHKHKL